MTYEKLLISSPYMMFFNPFKIKNWSDPRFHAVYVTLLGVILVHYNILIPQKLIPTFDAVSECMVSFLTLNLLFAWQLVEVWIACACYYKIIPLSLQRWREWQKWTKIIWLLIVCTLSFIVELIYLLGLNSFHPCINVFEILMIPTNLVIGILVCIHDWTISILDALDLFVIMFDDEKRFRTYFSPIGRFLFIRLYATFTVRVWRQFTGDCHDFAHIIWTIIVWYLKR